VDGTAGDVWRSCGWGWGLLVDMFSAMYYSCTHGGSSGSRGQREGGGADCNRTAQLKVAAVVAAQAAAMAAVAAAACGNG
jgi:hypothetical protein